jgi:uncharacterized protein (TIGR02594 family)
MAARTEVLESMQAAQEDREAAKAAGDNRAFELIFVEIVKPLNKQFARLPTDPMSDDAEMRLTLQTLDTGLAAIAGEVAPSRVPRTRARAEALRQKLGAPRPPRGSVHPDIPPEPPVDILDTPNLPPPGPAGRFVSARKTADLTVVYIDGQGREVVRRGGSRSWRNNNPGNIRKGSFAENAGSIGDDTAFAIFPDEALGLAAVITLLRSEKYTNLSLRDALFKYAPPSENDSEAYVAAVVAKTGIAQGTILRDLPVAKIRAFAGAIKDIEGWRVGDEGPNSPASAAAGTGAGISAAAGAAGEWMAIAEREAALPERERSEWPDPEENPRILEYFRVAASWFEVTGGDEVDWCAAFVNFCLVTSGHIGTDHPGARSFFWNKKGQFVPLDAPKKGAIAVRRYAPFDDAAWPSGPGHVGFVISSTATHVTLLGGNQSHTVRIQEFPLETFEDGKLASRFVAFMMPVIS